MYAEHNMVGSQSDELGGGIGGGIGGKSRSEEKLSNTIAYGTN